MAIGKLVAITGPAAVGKSTIATALLSDRVRGGELWLNMALDNFGRALPRHWIAWDTHHGRYAARGFAYARAEDGSVDLVLGSDGRRVLAAFHRSVAAVVASGVNVICETIVYDDDDWNDWTQALLGIPACWVKLGAPLEALEAREKADATRAFQGLARGMSTRKPVGKYDVEADTVADSAAAIVERVVAALPV